MDVANAEGLVLNSLVRIRPVGKNGKECLATTCASGQVRCPQTSFPKLERCSTSHLVFSMRERV